MSVPIATRVPAGNVRTAGRAVSIALASVLSIVLATWLVQTPDFVDLTVANPTDYHVNVRVRSAGDGAVVLLGEVGHGTDNRFGDVLDQGESWVFEFRYANVEAGAVELSREQLQSSDWRIEVPADVDRQLEAAGVGRPPP